MRVINYPDIFQENMNKHVQLFDYIGVHIDDILVLKTSYWNENFVKLEHVVNKVKENRLKCNIKNKFWPDINTISRFMGNM